MIALRNWLPPIALAVVGVFVVGGVALLVWGVIGLSSRGLPETAADFASVDVAGATLLLAGMTGLLALFTWRALASAQQEILNTEAALKAERDQVDATNRQAEIARETMLAGWRPLLVEIPRPVEGWQVIIQVDLAAPFDFGVSFLNLGRGPAFVTKALFVMGDLAVEARAFRPRIAAPDRDVMALFTIDPNGPTRSLASAIHDFANQHSYGFTVAIEYHDLGAQMAWRSSGSLEFVSHSGKTRSFELRDVEVLDITTAKPSEPASSS